MPYELSFCIVLYYWIKLLEFSNLLVSYNTIGIEILVAMLVNFLCALQFFKSHPEVVKKDPRRLPHKARKNREKSMKKKSNRP